MAGLVASIWGYGCKEKTAPTMEIAALKPGVVTETTPNDTDDPAIWYNAANPEGSLVLGTDKGDTNGGIFVFDLNGKLVPGKSIDTLLRPNNIDIAYGFLLDSQSVDIAVFTERGRNAIRVLKLPEVDFIDGGGIPVFEGDSLREPMGIALYKDPQTGQISAIVSRKTGPDGAYLWQYQLSDSAGIVIGREVRRFGSFKGGKEIEAIAVDNALGYVYYSDEGSGVRKYYAHPDSSNQELAFFGDTGFQEDHEGISIYTKEDGSGFILVSDQQANQFQVFTREGHAGNPHDHQRVGVIPVSTRESDGSEVIAKSMGSLWPNGLFVAMSEDRTFQFYDWKLMEAYLTKEVKK